jgi:membrane dipeptidase
MDAHTLHHDAVVADTHNDLLMLVAARESSQWGVYFRERWLPQLRTGGVDVQVLPVFIDDEFRPEGSLRQTLKMIEAGHRVAEANRDEVGLCLTGDAIQPVLDSGRIALVLALEGCPAIDTDVELLETLFRLGVRIASFAHFGRSMLADGSGEDAAGSRLTRAGVEALAELERMGMMLDISHLGLGGVSHVLELARRPILATHSSARTVWDHHRNLTDEHLRGIAAGGGVVCVNFVPGFVDPHDATVDRLVDHIEHIVNVAGLDHVGLGPDFVKEVLDEKFPLHCELVIEGIDAKATLPGLEGPGGLPLVTEGLVRRGFGEEDIRKILGGNVLRLFEAELGVPLSERRSLTLA